MIDHEKWILPKGFIQKVLIVEIGDVVGRHPYLSFSLMAIGIEFLGKCMMVHKADWHWPHPKQAFDEGAKLLHEINIEYKNIKLKDGLRNGFAHSFSPRAKVGPGERNRGISQQVGPQYVLVAEDFYEDFAKGCKMVIGTPFNENDKMNRPLLYVG